MPPNLLHTLRPDSVSVTLLGRFWELQAHTAADWLGAIAWDPEQLSGVMPGLIDNNRAAEMLSLSMHTTDIESRWLHSARAAIGRSSGRDWWWSLNLSMRCLAGWPYINGLLLHRNVHAGQLGFSDWLDAAYMLLWERQDESGRMKLDMELMLPPKGSNVPMSKAVEKKMLAAFAAD